MRKINRGDRGSPPRPRRGQSRWRHDASRWRGPRTPLRPDRPRRRSTGSRTLDNAHDVTFNQLLGINDQGLIAGYFGSGAQGHPNKGYLLLPPYGQRNYVNENFPRLGPDPGHRPERQRRHGRLLVQHEQRQHDQRQLRLLGADGQLPQRRLPDRRRGQPAGGPAARRQRPATSRSASGPTRQGNNHGYEYNIKTHRFSTVTDQADPGASLTAAAINKRRRRGRLLRQRRQEPPTASSRCGTAGSSTCPSPARRPPWRSASTTTTRSSASTPSAPAAARPCTASPGSPAQGFRTVDDPHGIGTTTINGVNNAGQLVGFYVDAAGNTDGFLATR